MSIDLAYATYQAELKALLLKVVAEENVYAEKKELFVTLVPLWTLINGFLDEAIAINPTKDLLLSYLSGKGDTVNFVKVASEKRLEREHGLQLKQATRAVAFTSYFDELISDSLALTNAFHMYNYRECAIALRCLLEDLYRHLYYKDNREDFMQVHELGRSENDIGVAPKTFRTYLDKASYLQRLLELKWAYTVGGKQCTGLLQLHNLLYGKYSSYVHGSSPKTLNQFASNLDCVFDAVRSRETIQMTNQFVAVAVGFLLFAHSDYFSHFNESTKRIVLSAFSQAQRQALRKLLSV